MSSAIDSIIEERFVEGDNNRAPELRTHSRSAPGARRRLGNERFAGGGPDYTVSTFSSSRFFFFLLFSLKKILSS